MRCVITRVFPLPGPARINTGPSVAVTASRCGSLSPASKFCDSVIVIFPNNDVFSDAQDKQCTDQKNLTATFSSNRDFTTVVQDRTLLRMLGCAGDFLQK